MITREDDDGVFVESTVLEYPDQLADLVVNKAASCEVGASSANLSLIRNRVVPQVDTLHDALRVRILLILRDLDLGQRDVDILVEIPIILGHSVGVVGMRQGNSQGKRPTGLRGLSSIRVQVLSGLQMVVSHATEFRSSYAITYMVHDLFIVVQLIRAHG